MIAKTQTKIDHDTFTISFERAFAAAREDVFEAWTDPAQLSCWWDPTGTPLADCSVDLRPGGAFCFTTASKHAPPFSGTYRVIEPPTRLVFDALGAVGTVRLETEGGATRMHVSIRCASAEHLDQFIKHGVDEGTDRTLDNLVTHVEQRRRAS